MTTQQVPQHLAALARANEVKNGWSAYRRDLAAMQSHQAAADVADMLDTIGLGLESDSTIYAAPVAVEKVIGSIRLMGPSRVRKLCRDTGMQVVIDRPWMRVRDLKPHEAFALADGLRRLHPALAAEAPPAPRSNAAERNGFNVDAAVEAWRDGVPAAQIASREGRSRTTTLRVIHAFEARETAALRRTVYVSKGGEK